MKNLMKGAALACLLASSIGATAAAQAILENSVEAVASVARGFGTVEIDYGNANEQPLITGAMNGVNYGILFYDCEGAFGCDSIQLYAFFTTNNNDLSFINEWNAEKRFASAYRDNVGDVVLQMNVNLDFGISRTNFTDSMDLWSRALAQFTDRVYDLPEGTTAGTASSSATGGKN